MKKFINTDETGTQTRAAGFNTLNMQNSMATQLERIANALEKMIKMAEADLEFNNEDTTNGNQ